MKPVLAPGFRSTMFFALFLVFLAALLITTTTIPAQRNNRIMRERRHDLVEEAADLERRRENLFAEQRALGDDPIHVERLHRSIFGSVSSEREVRIP